MNRNRRGPAYAVAGAASAFALCLGAMIAGPAVVNGIPAALAARAAGTSQGASLAAVIRADRQRRPAPRRTFYPGVPYAPPGSFLAKEEAQGGDCTLTVPRNPLSAQGLATPYQLGNGPNTTGCTMANSGALGAFVQATILEPGGHLFAYDPLVITAGTTPAATPPVPVIPPGSVVTIDTAFAANILFLVGPGAGFFVQGLPGSPFGQVAYANAAAFDFAARIEHVTPPALGTAIDGKPCPTVTDYSLTDQDPADNVTTLYSINGNGQTAEQGAIPGGTLIGVGSDNHLLDGFVDPALGCTGSEFTVPSLDGGPPEATEATDNLLAAANQQPPTALVPVNDPMTTVGADIDIIPGDLPNAGNFSVLKTDLYRIGADQPLFGGSPVADAIAYCAGMINAGGRVAADAATTAEMTSPSLAAGTNLSQFMLARYAASLTLLNCAQFGGVPAGNPALAAAAPATPATTPPATPATTPPATPATTPPATPPATPSDTTTPDTPPSTDYTTTPAP